jgi:hypothetical protein
MTLSWIVTGLIIVLVARLIWVEVRQGRRIEHRLSKTNAEIDSVKHSALATYQARFGKDPTGVFATPTQAAKKP